MWALWMMGCESGPSVVLDVEPAPDTATDTGADTGLDSDPPWTPAVPLTGPSTALTPLLESSLSVQMWGLLAGDVDGDGHTDVVRVLGSRPGQVGDLNGDGHREVAYYLGGGQAAVLEPVEGSWHVQEHALVQLHDTFWLVGAQAEQQPVLVAATPDALRLWRVE